ncbi:DnaJ subfamily C member 17 [Microdochium nivale]|nr:DnaJ subfamily C member 17 [Microdochium nivale]
MADASAAAAAAAELLAHARAFASAGEDLYSLLGVDATTAKADIHRAWRKRSLKHHPDKTGDAFDPEVWQRFERARDVLSDSAARQAYDAQRSADMVREQAKMAMDDKKRRMVEDLEAREKAGREGGAAAGSGGGGDGAGSKNNMMSEAERKKTAEAGRRRVEERQRLMREAEQREQQRAAEKDEADLKREADLERRIGEIQARKAAKEVARRREAGEEDGGGLGPDGKEEDVDMADAARDGTEAGKNTSPEVLEAQERAAKLAAEAAAIPRVRGDFSHTYARLKAAQAAKEARQLARQGMTT